LCFRKEKTLRKKETKSGKEKTLRKKETKSGAFFFLAKEKPREKEN